MGGDYTSTCAIGSIAWCNFLGRIDDRRHLHVGTAEDGRHYFYNKMLFFSDHCSCRIAGGEKGISMEDFKHDEDDIEECFC